MARRPRHLSPEERALWDHVVREAAPMHKSRPGIVPDAAPETAQNRPPPKVPAPEPRDFQPFRVGEQVDHRRSDNLLPGLAEDMGRMPMRMDARTHTKMKRGKLAPEARIDLHGMTLAQAHPALTGFILSSHSAGRRLVLVITGKGKLRDDFAPMPVRHGILRHQVPQWLSMAPMAQCVLQITPAHISHGGIGAYYVYLRRHR